MSNEVLEYVFVEYNRTQAHYTFSTFSGAKIVPILEYVG